MVKVEHLRLTISLCTLMLSGVFTVSSQCDIEILAGSVICNPNGTWFDPTDDVISQGLYITNGGAGGTFTADDPNSTTGTFGTTTVFGPYASNGQDVTFLITSDSDSTCFIEWTVEHTCNYECEIQSVAVDSVVCNDNGTPNDPSDDFISFQAIVNGFDISDEYFITSDNGPISPVFGTYDTTSSFQIWSGFGGSPGPTTLTFIDVANPECTFEYILPAVGPSCSCNLTFQEQFVTCIDGDIAVYLSISNGGVSGTFTADDPLMTTGSYDTTVLFGPYNTNAPITFTITSDQDPACQTPVTIPIGFPPDLCDGCSIDSVQILSVSCNDNGTPTDLADDYVLFSINPDGVNTSGTYNITSSLGPILPGSGDYGIVETFQAPPGSAGSGQLIITIADADSSNCTFQFTLDDPGSCSTSQCQITDAGLGTVTCNDFGSPGIPGDDYIEITLDPTGIGLDSTYIVTSDFVMVSPGIGTYGGPTTMSLFNAFVAGDPIIITITDSNDPDCFLEVAIPNVTPCLSCFIDPVSFTLGSCNDNGTPGDPSDDTYTIDLNLTGSGVSPDGWTASDPLSSSGQYDTLLSLGPYLIADGGFTMVITDADDPSCTYTETIVPPAVCSVEPCVINIAQISNIECNDNGTPADPGDDFIEFILNATGTGVASTYTISASSGPTSPSTGTYGSSIAFSTSPGTAGNGNITITLIDDDDNQCQITGEIADPGVCSTPVCIIDDFVITNIVCNDNGTANDPSDDYIDFTMTVSGANTGAGYTVTASNGTVTPLDGDYTVPVSFSTAPGTAGIGAIVLTVTDNLDGQCQVSVNLDDPGVCSAPCLIEPMVDEVVCADNGTPSDPSDDLYSFTLTVAGSAQEWFVTQPDTLFGEAMIPEQIGPFLISDGPLELIVTDANNSGCTESILITPPQTCSDACEIHAELVDVDCNDNGTPQTSADDIYVITVVVSGANNGPGWEVTDPVAANGSYNIPEQIGPLALNNTVDIDFFDQTDPSCMATLTIVSAAGCSSGCTEVDSTFLQAETCDENAQGTTTQVFSNAQGCDSVVISETVLLPVDTTFLFAQSCNPPDTGIVVEAFINDFGCDSIVLTETVLLPGDTTFLQSQTCIPAEAGVFVQLLSNNDGCDSVVVEEVSFSSSDSTFIFSQTCDSLQAGVIIDTLVNENGCDSLVFLETSYIAADTTLIVRGFCDPADTASTVETLVDNQGCDSVVITQGVLLPSDTTLVTGTTCIPAEAGISTQILQNAIGCDSVVVTERQLLASDSVVMTMQTCDPDDAGIDIESYVNVNGCDSVVITETIFAGTDTTFFMPTLCSDDSILVNDTYYSRMLPEGTEVFQNADGCDSVVTVSVKFRNDPIIRVVDTTLCRGESIEVNGEVFDADNPSGIQVFQYQGSDCDSLVLDITISIDSLLVDVQVLSPPCAGVAGTVIINSVSGGSGPYEISLNNTASSSTMEFPVSIPSDSTGTNVLSITDARGCSTLKSVELDEALDPQILIDSVIIIEEGTEIRLQPEVSFSYDSIAWNPGAGLSCTDCLQPVVTGGSDRVVSVTAFNRNGCTAGANIILVFSRQSEIYAPNVFSPNGDGLNDYFTLFTDDVTSMILRISIFDRWGNQVFERNDFPPNQPSEGWDGRVKGTQLDPGVFVFTAQLRGRNGNVQELTGDVTLVR